MEATTARGAGGPGSAFTRGPAFEFIELDRLQESAQNPRKRFDPARLAELTESIREKGVLVPLLVRPVGGDSFEIVAGSRRFRAARAAGLAKVPVLILEMTDVQVLEAMLIENLQREDIHPLHEADGYRALLALPGYDVPAIAAKVAKSESYVYQRLKLAELVPKAREAFLSDEITAGHAILIARLQPKDQIGALEACFEHLYAPGASKLKPSARSVRRLADWIANEIHLDLAGAPWKKDDAGLVPKAGACTTCPKRTGFSPALFPDIAKKDLCTDPGCFQEKRAVFLALRKSELKAKGVAVVEISRDWQHDRKEKALGPDAWRPAKRDCEKTATGLIVHGKDVGQAITICTNKACKRHRDGGGSHLSASERRSQDQYAAEQRASERKAAVEARARLAILDAVLAKVPAAPGRFEMERILLGYFGDVWAEFRKRLIQRWFKEPAKGLSSEYEKTLLRKLPEIPDELIPKMLLEITLVRAMHVSPGYTSPEHAAELNAAAKHYKVDAEKIRRRIQKEAADADRAKKAKKSVGKKSGAVKKATRSPARKVGAR